MTAIAILLAISFVPSEDPKPPAPFAVRVVGSGPPMILIPGLACSGEVWDATVDRFKATRTCHVLTLAGFAGQPPVEGDFLEAVRSGIVAYIKAEKLDHPTVVGHSLGGFLAMWLAATEPDLVGPIVSVDGLPCLPALLNEKVTTEQMKAIGEGFARRMEASSREDYVKNLTSTLSAWISDPAKRDLAAKWGSNSDPKTVARAMGALLSRDLRPEVKAIRSRVLLVAAPVAYPGVSLEAMKRRYSDQVKDIPRGRVAFADGSKHFVMFDKPDWLFEQIEAFLSEK